MRSAALPPPPADAFSHPRRASQAPPAVPEVTAADQAAINEFNRLFQKSKEVAAEVKAKKVRDGVGCGVRGGWVGGRGRGRGRARARRWRRPSRPP